MNNRKTIALAVALASASGGVQAQSSGDELMLEEIIVTARKRAESVQDVPLSIVPFSADMLERRDIQNMEDLATNTIGLSYSGGISSGVQGTVTIRGLATNFVQDRFQNVGIYLDGLYLQRQSMMNIGMVDLERVEVVKGPQNALYGRNAFAGAINYVTKKPTEELEAYLMTTQGNDDRQDYRGAISGKLIEDRLFGRLAFGTSEYDGANENAHTFADANIPGYHNDGNLGGWDDQTWSAALLFKASRNLEMGLSYYDADLKREMQGSYFINGMQEVARFGTSSFDDMNFNQKSTNFIGVPVPVTGNTMWKGELPYLPGKGTYIAPFGGPQEDPAVQGSVDPRGYGSKARSEVWNFTADWEISQDWSLRYQGGYIDHDSKTSGPAQRDPLAGSSYSDIITTLYTSDFSSRPNSAMDTTSHELRLDWNGGDRLFISGGLYYSEVNDESYDLTIFAPPCSDRDLNNSGSNEDEIAGCSLEIVPGMPSPLAASQFNGSLDFFDTYWGSQQSNLTKFDDTVIAAFAEITYDLTENMVLRLEGRYTSEERKIERLTDNFALPPGESGTGFGLITGPVTFDSNIAVPNDDKTFDYFTPRVSLDWSWSDSNMIYGYVAKGVKSGGFNNATDVNDLTYDEETNWTYELGSKNIFFNNRLTLNASLFYIDWQDIQGSLSPVVQSQNSNTVTGNIGDASNYGFEIETTLRFTQAWSIDAAYTWIKPEYDDDTEYDAAQRYYYYGCELDFIPPGEVCGDTDVGGNQLARTSETEWIAALNYNDLVFSGWGVNARADASYRDKQYLTPMNVGYIGDRTLYSATLNVISPEQHWDITVWGKNLSDEKYVSGSFTNSLFNKFLVAQGQRRSYGVTLKYNL